MVEDNRPLLPVREDPIRWRASRHASQEHVNDLAEKQVTHAAAAYPNAKRILASTKPTAPASSSSENIVIGVPADSAAASKAFFTCAQCGVCRIRPIDEVAASSGDWTCADGGLLCRSVRQRMLRQLRDDAEQ